MKDPTRGNQPEAVAASAGSVAARAILFADMDGTILDKETYAPGPALAALRACRDAGVPVVLNSSKTRAEMEVYVKRFPILSGTPFIVENGGGIFFPYDRWNEISGAEKKGDYWRVTLGADREQILEVLRSSANRLGLAFRPFSEMKPEEIAQRTGLSVEQARLAANREFDEPFWLEQEEPLAIEALGREVRQSGMKLTRGGRCHHVHGAADKGTAARYVQDVYRRAGEGLRSAGVGDAANDLPLFRVVDVPYLVRRWDGTYDPEIPRDGVLRFVEGAGPDGFAEAAYDFLQACVGWTRP